MGGAVCIIITTLLVFKERFYEKAFSCSLVCCGSYGVAYDAGRLCEETVVYSTEKPLSFGGALGSNAFVPPAAGLLVASAAVNLLLKDEA